MKRWPWILIVFGVVALNQGDSLGGCRHAIQVLGCRRAIQEPLLNGAWKLIGVNLRITDEISIPLERNLEDITVIQKDGDVKAVFGRKREQYRIKTDPTTTPKQLDLIAVIDEGEKGKFPLK